MCDQQNLKTSVHRKLMVFLLIVLSSTPVFASDDWIYSVGAGENLWGFADRYLKNVSFTERLRSYNQIDDPYHIPPGTKIKVPIKWLKLSPFFVRVDDLHGQAWVTEADSGQRLPLQICSLLVEGDKIETLDGSGVP